jgi:voltage-gated potassium channel
MFLIKVFIEFIQDKEYRELLFTTIFVLIFGTITFHFIEGWRLLDSFYFCFITLTTIGYGDFSPQTDLGKIFTMVYIVIGLGLILSFIRTIYDHFNNVRKNKK